MTTDDYPQHREHLEGLVERLGSEIPTTLSAFQQLHKAAISSGALDIIAKECIALGIAIAVRCDGCIAYHVAGALDAGAEREQVTETIAVAVLMGGGPALVYGAEALEALDQFAALEPSA